MGTQKNGREGTTECGGGRGKHLAFSRPACALVGPHCSAVLQPHLPGHIGSSFLLSLAPTLCNPARLAGRTGTLPLVAAGG